MERRDWSINNIFYRGISPECQILLNRNNEGKIRRANVSSMVFIFLVFDPLGCVALLFKLTPCD